MVNAPMKNLEDQVEYFHKSLLETACLAEVGQCSTQVVGTPFLSSPLFKIFGEMGCRTTTFDQVLVGKFVPLMECNAYIKTFLMALATPPSVLIIEPPSLQDYSC